MSHVVGIFVAVAVVGTFVTLMYISSESYAASVRQDRMDAMTLDELIEVLKGNDVEGKVEALLAVGKNQDRLDERLRILGNGAMSNNPMIQATSEAAVAELGEPTIPVLKTMLETGDFRGDAQRACACIRALGPVADSLAPAMTEYVKNGDSSARISCLFAFQSLSADKSLKVLDEVIESLDDQEFNVQCNACRVIERIGPDAYPAVERLIRLSEEGNVSTRGWAMIALGAIGPVDGHDIAGVLGAKLTAFTQVEKERALKGLANMGRDGESTKEEVEKMMTDEQRRCMPQAAVTYAAITGEPEKPLEVLRALLNNDTYRVRALEGLGAMGADSASAIEDVVKLLNHADAATRESAVMTLGKIGPSAKSSLEPLSGLANDSDPLVRQAVSEALERINRE